jgi:biotin carboxyl carrier protein
MSTEEKQGVLNINSSLYTTRISKKFLARKKFVPANPLIITSYIPGTVLEIFVTPGKEVKKGEDLMIVDAMKMKNKIKSGIDGIVKTVSVAKGAKVAKGSVLVELE